MPRSWCCAHVTSHRITSHRVVLTRLAAVQGVGDALTRIVKDEGVGGLFRGAGPTVARAMALNMGMLASNDQVLLPQPGLLVPVGTLAVNHALNSSLGPWNRQEVWTWSVPCRL